MAKTAQKFFTSCLNWKKNVKKAGLFILFVLFIAGFIAIWFVFANKSLVDLENRTVWLAFLSSFMTFIGFLIGGVTVSYQLSESRKQANIQAERQRRQSWDVFKREITLKDIQEIIDYLSEFTELTHKLFMNYLKPMFEDATAIPKKPGKLSDFEKAIKPVFEKSFGRMILFSKYHPDKDSGAECILEKCDKAISELCDLLNRFVDINNKTELHSVAMGFLESKLFFPDDDGKSIVSDLFGYFFNTFNNLISSYRIEAMRTAEQPKTISEIELKLFQKEPNKK
ncbi:MAG: hypothetical protein LBR25_02740 [Erysipelotrichaceae bacterium]|jgi:hypothetical protein|nr:hypothetical protein [Erysipelotrichaceae bacterium]